MALLFSLLFFTTSFAADMEFHGYLRAGTGSNGKSAKMECVRNQGSPAGNEFRMGNECEIYGEAAVRANFFQKADKPYFLSQLRFAFNEPGNVSYEDTDSDGRDINVVEAFVEAGNLDGSPITYWAGKRFYRDVDVYIFDWYYYAEMNGNGAGVGNIPLGSGTLAAAYLFQTGTTRTNIGVNQSQVLDLRWQDIHFGEKGKLHFWGAYGEAPGAAKLGVPSATADIVNRNGWLLGTRWRQDVKNGFNDLAIVHGENLLDGLNLWGDKYSATLPPSRRWRFVEHISSKPWEKIGIHAAAAAEFWDPHTAGKDSRGSWYSVGVRPIYYFTEHKQLAFEAGHSIVNDRTERNADGSFVGNRSLTRLTIAPQLAVGPGLWDRPLLRVYYTRSFWNGSNKTLMAAQAPSYAGALSSQAMGVQAELWF